MITAPPAIPGGLSANRKLAQDYSPEVVIATGTANLQAISGAMGVFSFPIAIDQRPDSSNNRLRRDTAKWVPQSVADFQFLIRIDASRGRRILGHLDCFRVVDVREPSRIPQCAHS
jgi:hypothetical protein